MTHMGFWVGLAVGVFMLGSFLSARTSPYDRALGALRDRAKKLGFIPRLIAAPEWIEHKKPSGKPGGMVAYYSVVTGASRPLLQARWVQGQWLVVRGEARGLDIALMQPLKGILALDIQSNGAGFYWDEDADLAGDTLESMKSVLISYATTR